MKISDSLSKMLDEIGGPIPKAIHRAHVARNLVNRSIPDNPTTEGDTVIKSVDLHWNRYQRRLRRTLAPELIGDYFTFREKAGLISYCPKGREQKFTENGDWALQGRQEIKPARWIKSILNPRFLRLIGGDKVLNDFAAKFSALESGAAYQVEVWPGTSCKINKAYRSDLYANPGKSSSLAFSCMRDENVGDFYSSFPNLEIAVIKKGDAYVGRALLWRQVHTPSHGTISFLDRIYAETPAAEHAFKMWARANDHAHKNHQQSGVTEITLPDGSVHTCDQWRVDSDGWPDGFLPFVDTFRYGHEDRESLCTTEIYRGNSWTFDNTDGTADGGPDDHEGEVLLESGEWCDEDEAVNINGEWYHHDDEDIYYCDGCGDYHHTDSSDAVRISLPRHEITICSDHYSTL